MLNVSLTEWEDLLPPKVCWMYLLLSGKTSYPQKYAECISCWVETLPLKYAECISYWVGRPPTPKSMLNVSLAEWEDLLPPKVCWMYLLLSGNPSPKVCWMYLLLSGNPSPKVCRMYLLLSGNPSFKVCWMYLLQSGKTPYPQKYAECISCWVGRPPTP